jgi:hypothetical protein
MVCSPQGDSVEKGARVARADLSGEQFSQLAESGDGPIVLAPNRGLQQNLDWGTAHMVFLKWRRA